MANINFLININININIRTYHLFRNKQSRSTINQPSPITQYDNQKERSFCLIEQQRINIIRKFCSKKMIKTEVERIIALHNRVKRPMSASLAVQRRHRVAGYYFSAVQQKVHSFKTEAQSCIFAAGIHVFIILCLAANILLSDASRTIPFCYFLGPVGTFLEHGEFNFTERNSRNEGLDAFVE